MWRKRWALVVGTNFTSHKKVTQIISTRKMVGEGVCMAGGMQWQGHAWQGACVVGGMHGGGMHSRGHVWQGVYIAGGMHSKRCTWQGSA